VHGHPISEFESTFARRLRQGVAEAVERRLATVLND
jgi:hypothetical protein